MKVNKKAAIAIGLSALLLTMTCKLTYAIKPKRYRRFGVRPLNKNRDQEGFFVTLIQDMLTKEKDHEMFFRYTRMTPQLFNYLLELVEPYLKKDATKYHISPAQRLMITVHFLAEGCSMQEISWGYRIGKSTAHVIIKETCKVIWEVLSTQYVAAPETKDEWKNIANGFFTRWNLPHCIGALDGKHVSIIAPAGSGTEFFNYKKHFSLVVMAVCDAYYRFIMIDVGAPGSNHDSSVFKESNFGKALLNGQLNIPQPEPLPTSKNNDMNYYICADSAFPLHTNIIRPFPGANLGEKKNIFNYRLSRGRRTIENTFGIWSQRWRILCKPIVAGLEMCELITQATIALHNFLQNSEKDLPPPARRYCPIGYADYYENGALHLGTWRNDVNRLKSIGRQGSNNATKTAKEQRDWLSDYFISPEGSLPWQENYVNRGALPEY